MLEVKGLVVAYGRVNAVKGIDFAVDEGQIVTLLGTNGAGKSTTLRTVSGLLKPVSGEIWFEGERLDGLAAHKIVERGIAQSPEGRRLFRQMSVEDNLKLGAFTRKDAAGVKSDMGMLTRSMNQEKPLGVNSPKGTRCDLLYCCSACAPVRMALLA